MQWSEDVYIVVLLDSYVGPTPAMAEFVRKQLLPEEEEDRIRHAIEGRIKGSADIDDLYSTCLSRSGLDLTKNTLAVVSIIEQGILQRSLFDLMTAGRARLFQLKGYSDVHEVRALIKYFFVKNRSAVERTDLDELWWDEADLPVTNHQPWLSVRVLRDPNSMMTLIAIFESWLGHSEELQGWLDDFEEHTSTVNNPKGENRVFSHEVALGIIKFAEVRCLN
jgi:hypothetical protein